MKNLLINRALVAKKKLFTFFLAIAASVGTMFASNTQVDGIWYDFDDNNLTAKVTYRGSADNSFDNEYSGTVVIPASVTYNAQTYSVTSIGYHAFGGCTGLTSVTIGNSVTSIGQQSFQDCTGLTSIEIPNSVTSIGWGAFYDCTGITSVTIGNSVTSLNQTPFYGCTSLTSIFWNAKNCADAASADSASFYIVHSQITSFVLGDEVEHIPAFLCYGMSKLTNITIPNSVTSIGDRAFRECSGLTSVTIPNSVTSIGTYTFLSCSNLKRLVVQNKNVQIDGGVYSIFAGATALTYISAPACIFDIHSDYTSYPSYFSQKLDTIEVTNGVLSANAMWMINLSRKTLQSVDLSGTTQTDLADEAFKEFYNMQTLKLPDNLLHIGYKSLAECVKLQSINIPANVTKIDDRAFENCRSLKTITFGGQSAGAPGRFEAPAAASQLQTIGNWAFYNCHELQNLTIPEGVTEIGDGAFYGCTYLEDLTLPASVQSIGDNTFALCAKLQKIVVNASVPPTIQAKTFFDVKRQIPVYVPDDVVSQYENDTYWSEFDIQGISHMPQGIDDINAATKFQKIVRDNQVLILRGDKTYTLTGQEVK